MKYDITIEVDSRHLHTAIAEVEDGVNENMERFGYPDALRLRGVLVMGLTVAREMGAKELAIISALVEDTTKHMNGKVTSIKPCGADAQKGELAHASE